MKTRALIVNAALWTLASSGCHQRHKEQLALEQVVLPANAGFSTVPDGATAARKNSYVTLVSGRTDGMFPRSLGVARVATPEYSPAEFDSTPHLAMEPVNELSGWMSLFDDIWAVSEVFPITYPTRVDRRTSAETLVEYARSDGAGLCLIYEITTSREGDLSVVDVQGSLYDAESGAQLIEAHADARVRDQTEDQLPPPPPADRIDIDERHIDPLFIAQRRFRELMRDAVLELIARDRKTVAPPRPKRRVTSDAAASDRRPTRIPD